MSSTLEQAVGEFLAQRRIAVSGVSREKPNAANFIYRKLREQGYQVYAVNPWADEVEGDPCFRSLAAIGGGVQGVVVGTHPSAALAVAQECAQLGIERLWLHRSVGEGSVSEQAVGFCREHGIAVIDGACPLMYLAPDFGHRCMRWVLGALGKLPDGEGYVSNRKGGAVAH